MKSNSEIEIAPKGGGELIGSPLDFLSDFASKGGIEADNCEDSRRNIIN